MNELVGDMSCHNQKDAIHIDQTRDQIDEVIENITIGLESPTTTNVVEVKDVPLQSPLKVNPIEPQANIVDTEVRRVMR